MTSVRHILWALLLIAIPAGATAQQAEPAPDPYLTAAVAALGENDFELGLRLLEKTSTRSSDPRIRYYTAFATEKLGRCAEARLLYQEAREAGPPRFSAAAAEALKEFDQRCVPVRLIPTDTPSPVVVSQRSPRRSNTAVTVGWVLTTVGALTLVAVPVKLAFDREIATQSEQYFEQVYECDVDFGKLADDCDAEAIESNPQWATYERRITTARRSTTWMLIGGGALLAGGITSVVIGAQKVPMALVPTRGGAMAMMTFEF